MDFNFVYCKLFQKNPVGVNTISCSDHEEYIAACLLNGHIHIYDTTSWHLIASIKGDENNFIRRLFWIKKLKKKKKEKRKYLHQYRLFSVGLNGNLDEWDLLNLTKKKSVGSTGGAIFDVVLSKDKRFCFAVCDDGCIKIFSLYEFDTSSAVSTNPILRAYNDHNSNMEISGNLSNKIIGNYGGTQHEYYNSDINSDSNNFSHENEEIFFFKSISRHSDRLLSICTYSDRFVYVGASNSYIKQINFITGEDIAKLKCDRLISSNIKYLNTDTKDSADKAKINQIQIWTLKCIEHRCILLSGDSIGNLCIWDIKTNTLLNVFRQHSADILDISIGSDNARFFSVGIDCKITMYSFVQLTQQWYVSMQGYPHINDITTVLAFKDGKVVTSSADSTMCVFSSVGDITGRNCHRLYLSVDLESVVTNADNTIYVCQFERIFLVNYQSHVDIWYLMDKKSQNGDAMSDNKFTTDNILGIDKDAINNITCVKISRIKLKKENIITSMSVSNDGKIIALGTQWGLRLFTMDIHELEIVSVPRIISDLKNDNYIYSLTFVDNDHIVLSSQNRIKFKARENNKRISDIDSVKKSRFCLTFYNISSSKIISRYYSTHAVQKFVKSNDSQWLAAISVYSNLTIYTLDLFKLHSTLPRFEFLNEFIVTVAFHPTRNLICVFSSNFNFYVYNLDNNSITNFCQYSFFSIPNDYLNRGDGEIGKVIWIEQRGTGVDQSCSKHRTSVNHLSPVDSLIFDHTIEEFVQIDNHTNNKYTEFNTILDSDKVDNCYYWFFLCVTYNKLCVVKFCISSSYYKSLLANSVVSDHNFGGSSQDKTLVRLKQKNVLSGHTTQALRIREHQKIYLKRRKKNFTGSTRIHFTPTKLLKDYDIETDNMIFLPSSLMRILSRVDSENNLALTTNHEFSNDSAHSGVVEMSTNLDRSSNSSCNTMYYSLSPSSQPTDQQLDPINNDVQSINQTINSTRQNYDDKDSFNYDDFNSCEENNAAANRTIHYKDFSVSFTILSKRLYNKYVTNIEELSGLAWSSILHSRNDTNISKKSFLKNILAFVYPKKLFLSNLPQTFNRKRYAT